MATKPRAKAKLRLPLKGKAETSPGSGLVSRGKKESSVKPASKRMPVLPERAFNRLVPPDEVIEENTAAIVAAIPRMTDDQKKRVWAYTHKLDNTAWIIQAALLQAQLERTEKGKGGKGKKFKGHVAAVVKAARIAGVSRSYMYTSLRIFNTFKELSGRVEVAETDPPIHKELMLIDDQDKNFPARHSRERGIKATCIYEFQPDPRLQREHYVAALDARTREKARELIEWAKKELDEGRQITAADIRRRIIEDEFSSWRDSFSERVYNEASIYYLCQLKLTFDASQVDLIRMAISKARRELKWDAAYAARENIVKDVILVALEKYVPEWQPPLAPRAPTPEEMYEWRRVLQHSRMSRVGIDVGKLSLDDPDEEAWNDE